MDYNNRSFSSINFAMDSHEVSENVTLNIFEPGWHTNKWQLDLYGPTSKDLPDGPRIKFITVKVDSCSDCAKEQLKNQSLIIEMNKLKKEITDQKNITKKIQLSLEMYKNRLIMLNRYSLPVEENDVDMPQ